METSRLGSLAYSLFQKRFVIRIKSVSLYFIAGSIIAVTVLALLLCLFQQQAPQQFPPIRNIVLISLDALRADHVGVYGYHRPTTPHIDRFAAGSLIFKNAVTVRPQTTPTFASVFTGLEPPRTGVREVNIPLPSNLTTLALILQEQKYKTAAFVSTPVLLPALSGVNRGFAVYYTPSRNPEGQPEAPAELRAEELTDAALKWLDKNGDKPFFLWIHYIDPHGPYLTPPDPLNPFTHDQPKWVPGSEVPLYGMQGMQNGQVDILSLIDAYDEEIRYADKHVGRLLDALTSASYKDRTLIVVTADHGESLDDEGYYLRHSESLIEGVIKVPLIIRLPDSGNSWIGTRSELVSLVDFMPTILQVLSLPTPEGLDGRSLVPVLINDTPVRDHAYTEVFSGGRYVKLAVRTKTHKAVYVAANSAGNPVESFKCYNLLSDPFEKNPLGCKQDTVNYLRNLLELRLAQPGMEGAKNHLDPTELEALQSLGYL